MFKQTQKILPEIADELFECVWPFCGVGALRVKISKISTKGCNKNKKGLHSTLQCLRGWIA